ncbi:MAG: Aurachin B dehydrogenase [Elusimicrobia bacterium]|nr:Aurachin B dehydrogenase [Elusimicrobiota bacterium]
MKPKILITGANGYTGKWLCRHLNEKGIAVRALVHNAPSSDSSNPLIEYVSGDLRDLASLKKAMEGIETVMHLAAVYRPANVTRKDFWDVNVEGVRNIVEAAAEAHVKKFVHCSTVGVHGTTGRHPINEDGPIKPDDLYQESKWAGEQLALSIAREKGLNLTVLRPAGIYGPGEKRFLKITQMIKNGRFIMFGNGKVSYHFVHVSDFCEAFWLASQKENTNGRVYIIADRTPIDIAEVVVVLAKAVGVKPPTFKLPYALLWMAAIVTEILCKPFGIQPPMHRRRAAWFRSERAYNIDRAIKELGYNPKVETREGLTQMVDSYKKAGWLN